jgi:CTP:molybdopterin cytidylyltransferase MocA
MNKPVLIVMAAGMGSRYGGLKQMDPVGTNGELIIDFSIYDAIKAGFEKVIFVIKKEMKNDFEELVNKRPGRNIEIAFAFQDINDLPKGY